MKDFFKMFFASCLGSLIVFGLSIFILIMVVFSMISSAISSSDTDKIVVSQNSVLKLDLSKAIYERAPGEFESYFEGIQAVGLNDLLKAIQMAKKDPNIEGIFIDFGMGFASGWATTEELRNALTDFKESGKFIYAYSDSYSQKGYYLSTIADSIFINPAGMLEFKGIAAEAMFIKDFLKKLDINVELIRPGNNAYKSAGEMYTMTKMSAANREQIRSYIESIWNHVVLDMSKSRSISTKELNAIADNLSAFLPEEAFKKRLVDRLAFKNDVFVSMISMMKNKNLKPEDIRFINPTKYAKSNFELNSKSKNRIAIIYAEGDVMPGKGVGINVYSTTITDALDNAANDDKIKAIVLRVNSPGGAVVASEIMTDAVLRAKAKKPVIVSMSDVAASAGYEISCYANKIVAMPTTITGSIGVFAVFPEVGALLKNKLGINTDTVLTNKNASALSILRPLSPTSHAVLTRNVEDFYKTFCSRVAQGRNLRVSYVDSIARGRVWTGTEAKKLGLVDELGGIDRALEIAAEEAEIENYTIVSYPKEKDLFTQLMELWNTDARIKLLAPNMQNVIRYYQQVEKISQMEPMQARLPYFIDF